MGKEQHLKHNSATGIETDGQQQFVELLLTNQRQITTYIATLLCSPSDVDDVFQNTSVVLWRKFGEFEPGTNFLAWACRTAYLKVLEFRRSQNRLPVFFSEETLDAIARTCSEQTQVYERLHVEMAKCIAKLESDDQKLLQVRFAEKATLKSTAQTLKHAINTVRKRLTHVYAVLFKCIMEKIDQE
jgi:RNA polymerase sigma-70 factor, ECF subfamily